MPHEMRKTVLFVSCVCIFLIVLEEWITTGSVSKHVSSTFSPDSPYLDNLGLATDGLVEGMTQAQVERQKMLQSAVGRKVVGEVEETKKPFENRSVGDENKDSSDRREKEKEIAEEMENERRQVEREREIQRNKEMMLKQKEKDGKEAEIQLLVKKKKDGAEKVLEDRDEDEDVDTDVEEEKSSQNVDKDGGGQDEEEDEEEEEEVPDERDEMEIERLEKSPYIFSEEKEQKIQSVTPVMRGMKTISEWQRLTPYTHSFQICRYNMCRWEKDNRMADAVLFRAGAIRTWVIKPFPRKPGSRWIMYTNDPAVKDYGLGREDVGANINATTTYQLHSDYPRTFGHLRRVKPPAKNYEKIFDGKEKQVAWFVSHCSTWSKREIFVERMRKIIPVDIFGACGNLTCGVSHYRGNDTNVCLPMLSEHYKFYLAFENSYCKDYVSEKFFKLFKGVDVIPVVQGGFDYHRYMPSNVFIDSSDFESPEDLARYLLELSSDKYRYVKILKRKASWTYKAAEPMHCVVCEKLHTDTKTRIKTDMVAEFNGKPSECYRPPWLKGSNKEKQVEE
ncbi:hypothetical protein RRG08_053134 [Elysia crispata]|uniref:Fucosyltransferase n=1 Tax=Elysia crispata TaxID=231223 RepID=A0AAE1DZJ2_9GAST|nr:hypothetical protein RRG08_053134 [Elysia crispata]